MGRVQDFLDRESSHQEVAHEWRPFQQANMESGNQGQNRLGLGKALQFCRQWVKWPVGIEARKSRLSGYPNAEPALEHLAQEHLGQRQKHQTQAHEATE